VAVVGGVPGRPPVPAHTVQELSAGSEPLLVQEWLARTQALHEQLRPAIPAPYEAHLHALLAEGAHMAVLTEGSAIRALAIWRAYLTTYAGRRFYVDDLVVDEALRGQGWGGALLAWLEDKARSLQCDTFALDSGTQRHLAHRFYFRAGMLATAFSFAKPLQAPRA